MANKSIKSRYSIEYAYPDASQKKKPRKKWPFLVVGFLSIGALASVVIPLRSVESFVASSLNSMTNLSGSHGSTDPIIIGAGEQSIEEVQEEQLTEVLNYLDNNDSNFVVDVNERAIPNIGDIEVAEGEKVVEIVEIDVEKLLLANKKQQEISQERLIVNQELTKKLTELTRQLTAEKDKIINLSAQINTTENDNKTLKLLLKDALYKAKNKDQTNIAKLDNVEKSESNPSKLINKASTFGSINSETIDISRAINRQVAKLLIPSTTLVKVDHNNAISLSTKSQVDAIVLAMQDIQQGSSTKFQKKSKDSVISTETSKAKITKADLSEELLHMKLQRQINQMLTSSEEKSNDYEKALEKESVVRKNAMRSITVQKGETLWSIAERAYGNGSMYTKIIEANPHITKDGKVILSIGQVIRVPI